MCTTWPSFLFSCRLLFIIPTHKLVVSRNFLSIRIGLNCFYLLIFYFEKFSTWTWRFPYTWSLNSLLMKEFHLFVFFQKSNMYSKNPHITWLCILYLVKWHFIFLTVDDKNWTVVPLQRFLKTSHAVYRLQDTTAYQMRSLRYRYKGKNEGLTALFATIISLNTKKRKIMLWSCIHTFQRLITIPEL